ncbi:MAG: hypothetical protein ACFE9R_01460 [Candidatus Hermodarchaeota archaeon]
MFNILSKQWRETHNWFDTVSHHKAFSAEEFFNQLEILENMLMALICPFYTAIDELDSLLEKTYPSEEDVEKAVALIKKWGHYEYFFNNLTSPHWLIPLKQRSLFSEPPRPIQEGNYIQFPFWPESQYLVKVTEKKPSVVLQIFKNLPETENFRIQNDFARAILKMPFKLAKETLSLVPRWLRNPYQKHSVLDQHLAALTLKFINKGEIDAAFKLADMLLDITIDMPGETVSKEQKLLDFKPDAKSYFSPLEYSQIIEKIIPTLVGVHPYRTLNLLIKKLSSAINLENKARGIQDKNYDLSHIWRPAIEDHEQNRGIDNIKDILVVEIRNLVKKLGGKGKEPLLHILSILREQPYPIFRRLELHTIRLFPKQCQKFINEIFSSKKYFEDIKIHHEYVLLLESQFSHISKNLQQNFLQWVEDESAELQEQLKNEAEKALTVEELNRSKGLCQLRRITPIKDFLPSTWKLKYDSMIVELGEPQHPEFVGYSTSGIGPISPLTIEELNQMTPREILEYLIVWNPPQEQFGPSPSFEGLGWKLKVEVQSRPQDFANMALEFSKKEVRPIYIYYLLSGLSQAVKNERLFDWGPVISLCKQLVKLKEPWSNVRKSIGDLLGAGLEESSNSVPFILKTDVWFILEQIAKDEEPTLEYEQESTMDPATLSINTIQGTAMHAIIRYALWFARNEFRDKPWFSSKMAPEVKRLLTNFLDPANEPTLMIRSLYGQYLPTLFYLDEDWVRKNLDKIFPVAENKHRFWNVVWGTYIIFNKPSEFYQVIRDQYKYAIRLIDVERTIKLLKDPNKRLAEHISLFYLHGKEKLTEEDSLVKEFFERAPAHIRGHAISFLGVGLEQIKNMDESELFSKRLKGLWEHRLAEAEKPNLRESCLEEICEFGWWFCNSLFDQAWTIAQLEATLSLTGGIVKPVHKIIKILPGYAEEFPLKTINALLKIIKADIKGWYVSLYREDLYSILQQTMQSGDKKAIELADELINFLGSKGIHEYRELRKLKNKMAIAVSELSNTNFELLKLVYSHTIETGDPVCRNVDLLKKVSMSEQEIYDRGIELDAQSLILFKHTRMELLGKGMLYLERSGVKTIISKDIPQLVLQSFSATVEKKVSGSSIYEKNKDSFSEIEVYLALKVLETNSPPFIKASSPSKDEILPRIVSITPYGLDHQYDEHLFIIDHRFLKTKAPDEYLEYSSRIPSYSDLYKVDKRFLERIIRNREEGGLWEFKVALDISTHATKAEFIRDMISLGNKALEERKNAFLIVGVPPEESEEQTITPNLADEATYQRIIASYVDPRIDFELRRPVIFESQIAIFVILGRGKRPYSVKKQLQGRHKKVELNIGDAWTRLGSSKKFLSHEKLKEMGEKLAK